MNDLSFDSGLINRSSSEIVSKMLMEGNVDRRINMNLNMKNEENNSYSVNDIEVKRGKSEGMKNGEILRTSEENVSIDNEEREYYGKKEKTKLDVISKESEDDYKVYNFIDSGIGVSWQLGNDSEGAANAFRGGHSKCPKDIIVPRSLTNEKEETRPVEVIGRWAYYRCGHPSWGPETKTVLVTKQVKVIKYLGFGDMYNVEIFRIEEGSVLQSIEGNGLHYIGYNTGINDAKKRGTLTLPSTLSSVESEGIRRCNLFKLIIYCGTSSLPKTCALSNGVEETKVKVTNQYSANTIFGQIPLKDSLTEVEVYKECQFMEDILNNKECNCSDPNRMISPFLVLVSILFQPTQN